MSNKLPLLVLALSLCVCGWFAGGEHSPVVPAPTPIVSPFESDKLRVLIVCEQSDSGSLPAPQQVIFGAASVRKSIKDAGGEFRIIDKDSDVSLDAKWVQEAWKLDRKELPTVIIGSPKGGVIERLPNNVDEMLALLKKYGGA